VVVKGGMQQMIEPIQKEIDKRFLKGIVASTQN
jgi:hypothetical protein